MPHCRRDTIYHTASELIIICFHLRVFPYCLFLLSFSVSVSLHIFNIYLFAFHLGRMLNVFRLCLYLWYVVFILYHFQFCIFIVFATIVEVVSFECMYELIFYVDLLQVLASHVRLSFFFVCVCVCVCELILFVRIYEILLCLIFLK